MTDKTMIPAFSDDLEQAKKLRRMSKEAQYGQNSSLAEWYLGNALLIENAHRIRKIQGEFHNG